jgi:hypothetical protein
VDGGPVDERRRREPRAHRFQAVEGTQIIEQPSSFAGGRSVEDLRLPRVKGDSRCKKHLEDRFERNDHADTPDGHSSLASALVVTTLGVRRVKEEGTAARHAGDIELASAPAPQAMRESAASGRSLQPSLDPSTCMPFSPPQEGGPGLRNRSAASSSSLLHSGRKLAAQGKLVGGKPLSSTRINRSRTCPCVVLQLQKS